MTQDPIGESLRENHAALVAGLDFLLRDGPGGSTVLVCDADDTLPPACRSERVVQLAVGAHPLRPLVEVPVALRFDANGQAARA